MPQVHRARDRRSGGLVALKHSYLPEGGALPRHVLRELAVLRAVHHPRLVSLLDYRQQVCAGAGSGWLLRGRPCSLRAQLGRR